MHIQYFDPYINEKAFSKCEALEDLLRSSDIITLHVHLNDETFHLLGEHNIVHVKQDCLLINTSRGKIWDEIVIAQALTDKRIKGIATDVLNTEPGDITLSPLWLEQQKKENVIITPHLGGATYEAMWACEEYIAGLSIL